MGRCVAHRFNNLNVGRLQLSARRPGPSMSMTSLRRDRAHTSSKRTCPRDPSASVILHTRGNVIMRAVTDMLSYAQTSPSTRSHPRAVIHPASCMHACVPCRHVCKCPRKCKCLPCHAVTHARMQAMPSQMPCHAVTHACMSSHKYISEMYVLFKEGRVLESQVTTNAVGKRPRSGLKHEVSAASD